MRRLLPTLTRPSRCAPRAVICHLTLAQMALNFVRYAVSPSLQEKATWLDSAWTQAGINKLAGAVKTIAALHDKHLSASSPHKHLVVSCPSDF